MSVSKATGIYLASATLYNIKNFEISLEGNTSNLCKYWNKLGLFEVSMEYYKSETCFNSSFLVLYYAQEIIFLKNLYWHK